MPGWVWLFTGTVLGGFIVFLMYLADLQPTDITGQQASTQNQTNNQTNQEEPNKVPKPRFDFYQMLKESELPATTRRDEQTTIPEIVNTEGKEFLLQAGSFRNPSDADRLRAELIMANLDAYVEPSQIREGEIWHRVITGPYKNRSEMAKARGILVSNDIAPMLLTREKK